MKRPKEEDRERDRGKYIDIRLGAGYGVIVREIDTVLADNLGRQVVIAIDGWCSSGKAMLDLLLQGIYGCGLFHMGDLFLRPGRRVEEQLQETGGSVDYE